MKKFEEDFDKKVEVVYEDIKNNYKLFAFERNGKGEKNLYLIGDKINYIILFDESSVYVLHEAGKYSEIFMQKKISWKEMIKICEENGYKGEDLYRVFIDILPLKCKALRSL